MTKRMFGLFALMVVFAMLVAACGGAATPAPEPTEAPVEEESAPEPTEAPAEEEAEVEEEAMPEKMKIGQITDVGGIDDKGFNQLAWDGMQRAAEDFDIEVQFLESQQQTDYEKNINEFLSQGYEGLITVGFLLADATRAASEANPDVPFAIVDFPSQTGGDLGLLFNVDEPSFMAGYLSAGMSETGTVCTYGGIKIPPVVAFMVGYEHGVMYYNEQNGTDVNVLGWKTDAGSEGGGDGSFTGNFESLDDGRSFAENFFDEGCDIIFPVAGPVGLGSAAAAQDRGFAVIGVDADLTQTNPDAKEVYLTSVLKKIDVAVYEAVKQMVDGNFAGGNNFIATTANSGVGLAPFYDWDGQVSDDLKGGLAEIEAGLIDGSISTGWPVEAMEAEAMEGDESLEIDPVRIAVVMPSTITDLAWSQAIYDSLVRIQGRAGGDGVVEISFTESMFNVTDAAAALRDYAADGNNIVIAHGTQYGSSLFEIAPDFPDTTFAWGTATDTGESEGLTNIFAYEARAEEGGYVNGVLAANLSESGVIGVVGPVEAGDAKLYIDGFLSGAVAANPDATVNVSYTGSFGDTALAAEAANTHIQAGADVLTGSAQQVVGAIGVASDKGVPWMGTQSDQSPLAPDIVVSTQLYDWDDVFIDIITKHQSGEFGGTVYALTLENGGLKMLYGDGLPEAAVAAAQETEAAIAAGDIVVEIK